MKVDVEVPKYNKGQILKNIEESKLARESSNFDQYLAKEKLQLSLNKSPLVSRELPKVKGVHDVEVPNELKDRLLNQFINAKNSHELMNILHHQDEELRGCLLEMIFTSEN